MKTRKEQSELLDELKQSLIEDALETMSFHYLDGEIQFVDGMSDGLIRREKLVEILTCAIETFDGCGESDKDDLMRLHDILVQCSKKSEEQLKLLE